MEGGTESGISAFCIRHSAFCASPTLSSGKKGHSPRAASHGIAEYQFLWGVQIGGACQSEGTVVV